MDIKRDRRGGSSNRNNSISTTGSRFLFHSTSSHSLSTRFTKLYRTSPGAKRRLINEGWPVHTGLLPDRIRCASKGEDRELSERAFGTKKVEERRSCVYDLSTSFQRGGKVVFPSPSVRPTDKPSFFCNFRGRSPGNPWKIRDPTESVPLSRRVTRVSGFVVLS